jgi:hypothetical protein
MAKVKRVPRITVEIPVLETLAEIQHLVIRDSLDNPKLEEAAVLLSKARGILLAVYRPFPTVDDSPRKGGK